MNKNEFDSEYCNVKYVEKDNVVFLTWKKYCSHDDYRTPTTFAVELLKNIRIVILFVMLEMDLKIIRMMLNGDLKYIFRQWHKQHVRQ